MNTSAIKHNLKWNTMAGGAARWMVRLTGLVMLRGGRKFLKWSGGRCSWCGANCGMNSTMSAKGLRCESLSKLHG